MPPDWESAKHAFHAQQSFEVYVTLRVKQVDKLVGSFKVKFQE